MLSHMLLTLLLSVDPTTMHADGVTPVAWPDQVRGYTQALQLTGTNLDTVSLVIEDYESSLREVHASMLEGIAGVKDQLNEAFAGRRRLQPAQLKLLRVQIESAPRSVWASIDARLDELVETLALLSPLPVAQADASTGRFRRQVLQSSTVDDETVLSASLRLDVGKLAERASDGELAQVQPGQIAAALAVYHVALDTQVPSWFREHRASRVDDALAGIANDRSKRVELMTQAAARWRAQDELHSGAVEAVARLALNTGGESARNAWLLRTQQARFPGIYDDHQLLGTRDWIERNGSIQQQQAVVQVYIAWMQTVRDVADTMSALMRKALEQGGDVQNDAVAWKPDVADIRRAWLQASGDRQVRLETARAKMERELTDGQRAAIRRALNEPSGR